MSSSMLNVVPPGAPLPHRKVIRSWIVPFSQRNSAHALLLTLADVCLFFIFLGAAAVLTNPIFKIMAGIATGFFIGRLFILGHDACHQSFTTHRRLNTWLGRLVFLPSLTPYSLWNVGHNVVHHGYTNLKDVDFVWQPLTLEEFHAMPLGGVGSKKSIAAVSRPGCIIFSRCGGSACTSRRGRRCPRDVRNSRGTACW